MDVLLSKKRISDAMIIGLAMRFALIFFGWSKYAYEIDAVKNKRRQANSEN